MTLKVKEKAVEQIELFYDLIYVYAISRLTLLVEEPVDGVIPPQGFLSYLVTCFIILQAWLYLTNYVNRYGRWRWYEYLLTAINMMAAAYTANTISRTWGEMTLAFNLSMLVMLLCVWAMYLIQVIIKDQDVGAARNSLLILTIVCALYACALAASAFGAARLVMWLDIAAVLVGAFLPFFIRGHFDIQVISFPHLAERFELFTIVTFGEGVVAMTSFFDVMSFSLRPVLVFCIILAMFGCYMLELHYMSDRQRVARALRLMFSHYFIAISINLATVAFHFLENAEADRLFTAGLMSVALAIFYVSILADDPYCHERCRLTRRDVARGGACLAAGIVFMFLGCVSTYALLLGALVATAGSFLVLLGKYRRGLALHS